MPRILHWLESLDPIALWKACSVVLTGAFGILGLLTEFKSKHSKKITRWGYVSLAGIIVSTILGTIAQVKESQDNAKTAADAATKTLQIAKDTQSTLVNVRRLLTPLNDFKIVMEFPVPCGDEVYKEFCKAAAHRSAIDASLYAQSEAIWEKWPLETSYWSGLTVSKGHKFDDSLTVKFYRSSEQAKKDAKEDETGDASMLADVVLMVDDVANFGKDPLITVVPDPDKEAGLDVFLEVNVPGDVSRVHRSNQIASLQDLNGAVAEIEIIGHGFQDFRLKPDSFQIETKDGYLIRGEPIQHLLSSNGSEMIDLYSLEL
jgi:hypothetical protein